MPFPQRVKEDALVKSRRCCCICNKFAGRAVEVHHIKQEADGGTNTIENAIVLCVGCHSEVGHYNPRHPIGNKYKPSEIVKHRDAWWKWCDTNPSMPLPSDAVVVTPRGAELIRDGWKTKIPIKVHNRSSEMVYDVYLGITYTLKNVNMSNMNVNELSPKSERTLDIGGAKAQLVSITGKLKASDNVGDYLQLIPIYSLNPNEVITYQASVTDSVALRKDAVASIKVAILDYKEEPNARAFVSESERTNSTFTHEQGFYLPMPAGATGMTDLILRYFNSGTESVNFSADLFDPIDQKWWPAYPITRE